MVSPTTSRIGEARYVHTGTGDMYVGPSFAPAPVPPANSSNLPHRHPHFVGRKEELRKVLEALLSRAWVISIDGLGGIGKTTLALEVAHLCRDKAEGLSPVPTFDSFIWTSLRDRPHYTLSDLFREILLVISPELPASLADQSALAKKLLAEAPRLIVIDNFEDANDEELLRFLQYLPEPSKALVTSRHHINTGERVINLHGLDTPEAVRLLKLEAERLEVPIKASDEAQLELVAKAAYGVPYVLRWAIENVRDGKDLDWALDAVKQAKPTEIFDFMYSRSLRDLDEVTQSVFTSLAAFQDFATSQQIGALTPTATGLPERLSALISRSLLQDNQRLVAAERRFRLHPFTRYLADRRFQELPDGGVEVIQRALKVFPPQTTAAAPEPPDPDAANMEHAFLCALGFRSNNLFRECIALMKRLHGQPWGWAWGREMFHDLRRALKDVDDQALKLEALQVAPDLYPGPMPVPASSRDQELTRVLEHLRGRGTGFVLLLGPRGIGKSSLLARVRDELKKEFECLRLDGALFFDRAAYAPIRFEFERQTGIQLGPSPRERIGTLSQLLEDLAAKAAPRRLLLLFDEMDLLSPGHELSAVLRLSISEGLVSMVGAATIYPGDTGLSSPLYNLAQVIHLGAVDPRASANVVTSPIDGLLKYEDDALARVVEAAGGQLMVLNVVASLLVYHALEQRALTINLEMVERVLRTLLLSPLSPSLLRFHREDDPRLLRAISRALPSPDATFSEEDLLRQRQSTDWQPEPDQLQHQLCELVVRGALVSTEDGRYRISYPLLWEWLHRLDHGAS